MTRNKLHYGSEGHRSWGRPEPIHRTLDENLARGDEKEGYVVEEAKVFNPVKFEMKVLDASAILPLVTRRGKQLIVEASHGGIVTTDLAIYEARNSLWKLAKLLNSISLEDAADVATALKDLAMGA